MYKFQFTLLDSELIDEFIYALHHARPRTDFFRNTYTDVVRYAIRYYLHDGHQNGDFDRFDKTYQDANGESLVYAEIRSYRQTYDRWDRKWNPR